MRRRCASRARAATRRAAARHVGLAALVCYYIGLYLLLFLSRTREYLADTFSAEPRRGAPSRERAGQDRLRHRQGRGHRGHAEPAASTRHLGVIDVKNARHVGPRRRERQTQAPARTAEAMLFDAYNPWARLIELNSTHPLTGMRIAHLGELAKEKGADASPTTTSRRRPCAGAARPWRAVEPVLARARAFSLLRRRRARRGPARRLAARAGGRRASACSRHSRLRYPSAPPQRHDGHGADDEPRGLARRRTPRATRQARRSAAPIRASSPARTSSTRTRPGSSPVDFRSMLGFIGDLFAGWRRVPKHFGQAGQRAPAGSGAAWAATSS